MVWTPLLTRLASLPLVIAGPILRNVSKDSVTVWLALKSFRQVKLQVKSISGYLLLESNDEIPIKIGTNLFIIAITAKASTNIALTPGEIYQYEIVFTDEFNNIQYLNSEGVLNNVGSGSGGINKITYDSFSLPTFCLPAQEINDLRILQCSCRKPHGEGLDALPSVDIMLDADATDAIKRPQMLIMGGDQIYADDVADILLRLIIDGNSALVGWDENLPLLDVNTAIFDPYFRKESVAKSNLTAEDAGYSHLMKFGEFIVMYLFCWSDVLWDNDFPTVQEVYGNSTEAQKQYSELEKKRYEVENKNLITFRAELSKVRKSLANIATYMIFDDHDVTDDWILNLEWFKSVVINNELGKRININGLTAFAVCQAWGNTPERFESGTIGHSLLSQIDISISGNNNWYSNNSSWENIEGIVLPVLINDNNDYSYLKHPEDANQNKLDWHFRLDFHTFEIIFLDERTLRGFTNDVFCERINKFSIYQQFINPPNIYKELTLIIAPAPLNGLPYTEHGQKIIGIKQGFREWQDTEAWGLAELAKERFFALLSWRAQNAQSNFSKHLPQSTHRLVILSGDVHYSFVNRMEYWAETTLESINPLNDVQLLIAQLTSSSLKNQTKDTLNVESAQGDPYIHPGLEVISRIFLLERNVDDIYAGWRHSNTEDSPTHRSIGKYKFESSSMITSHKIRYKSPVILKREQFQKDYNIEFLQDLELYNPDLIYRIDFIKSDTNSSFAPEAISNKDLDSRKKASNNHRLYASIGGNGKKFYGSNNLGEITFKWPDSNNKRYTYLKLWSRNPFIIDPYPDLPPIILLEELKPNNTFTVLMEFDTVQYPKPSINDFK